jgi:hypothetical protein
MNKFCGCNSEWEFQGFKDGSAYLIQLNYTPEFTDVNYSNVLLCHKCGYWRWYDVYYENMMYDLRSMNS